MVHFEPADDITSIKSFTWMHLGVNNITQLFTLTSSVFLFLIENWNSLKCKSFWHQIWPISLIDYSLFDVFDWTNVWIYDAEAVDSEYLKSLCDEFKFSYQITSYGEKGKATASEIRLETECLMNFREFPPTSNFHRPSSPLTRFSSRAFECENVTGGI